MSPLLKIFLSLLTKGMFKIINFTLFYRIIFIIVAAK